MWLWKFPKNKVYGFAEKITAWSLQPAYLMSDVCMYVFIYYKFKFLLLVFQLWYIFFNPGLYYPQDSTLSLTQALTLDLKMSRE